MPDFDTQTPPERQNRPLKLRIVLMANRFRGLLVAGKPHILSIENRLRTLWIASKSRIQVLVNRIRSLLIANRLRTLLIGGVLLLLVVGVPIGLPIYSLIGIGDGRQGSRIVFALDGDIWTVNADGSDMERLTYTGEREEDPTWSPDGEKIAFTREVQKQPESQRAGGAFGVPHVFVMDADGSDTIEISSSPEGDWTYEPSWSPDGRWIAFWSSTYCQIFIANADGSGAPEVLVDGSSRNWCPVSPEWSPDGGQIAFVGLDNDSEGIDINNIYVMNVSPENGYTSDTRRLTDNRSLNGDPAWSPDGTQIAFSTSRWLQPEIYKSDRSEIYKIDVKSLKVTRLTHSPHSDAEPTWSPDGEHIAYVNSKNNASIYKMDSDGSNSTPVFEAERKDVFNPDWGPRP